MHSNTCHDSKHLARALSQRRQPGLWRQYFRPGLSKAIDHCRAFCRGQRDRIRERLATVGLASIKEADFHESIHLSVTA
jgi:hypothetical protein